MKITFLTEEWTQLTKGSCSTFMRQMAIELSRLENVEIGILIPSASPKDKVDAGIFDEFFGEQKQYQNPKNFEILVFGKGNTEDFKLEGLHVAAEAVAHLNKYEPSYNLKVVGAPFGRGCKVHQEADWAL